MQTSWSNTTTQVTSLASIRTRKKIHDAHHDLGLEIKLIGNSLLLCNTQF